MTITHRVGGSPLTNQQLDDNFDYLDYGITLHGNSAYSILTTDKVVALNATLSINRIWTLPSAASIAGGRSMVVVDMVGGVSDTNALQIKVQTGEYFNGALNDYIMMRTPFDRIVFTSDGVSNWSAGVHINGQGQAAIQSALGLVNDGAWHDGSEFFRLNVAAAGDLVFDASSRRIYGEMSSATHSQRLIVVNSTTNGTTAFAVAPNGSSTTALFRAYGNSNPDAAQMSAFLGMVGTVATLRAAAINGGVQDALSIEIGTTPLLVADSNLNTRVGKASLSTTASNGFLYIPSCAGVPTGVPTAITGFCPLVVNELTGVLYVYASGNWVAQ